VAGNATNYKNSQGDNPKCSTRDEISQPSRPISPRAATAAFKMYHILLSRAPVSETYFTFSSSKVPCKIILTMLKCLAMLPNVVRDWDNFFRFFILTWGEAYVAQCSRAKYCLLHLKISNCEHIQTTSWKITKTRTKKTSNKKIRSQWSMKNVIDTPTCQSSSGWTFTNKHGAVS